MPFETTYAHIETLIIDDMATQLTTLRGQLAMIGIVKVDTAGTAEDALRLIRSKNYGLILCDYNLNQKTDGQQLFEYMREHRLLRSDSLFFMITAENSYNSVAAASEHLPDSYLLKPVTAGEIGDRLKFQLDRRQALLPIKQQLAKQELAAAVLACDALLAKKDRWYMQALQLKGQVELEMDHIAEAMKVFEEALSLRPGLIWAQLGMARAHKAAGRYDEAIHLTQDIIQAPEGARALAAFDVLAQSLEAQDNPQAAMEVLKQAAAVVPSARRHRQVAESAYRNGDLDTAKTSYSLAVRTSQGSITEQPQDRLALAQTLVEAGEPAEALEALKPSGSRAKRMTEPSAAELAISSQAHAKMGMRKEAAEEAEQALATMPESKADFATVAIAKAALMTGKSEQGLKLLQQALSADHENARIRQLVTKTLNDTGNSDQVEQLVGAATELIKTRVSDAKKLFREEQLDAALQAVGAALQDYPENTAVLLEAAQMSCMSLRRRRVMDTERIEEVRAYLGKLEKLMPLNERVAQMRRYFRETMSMLEGKTAKPAAPSAKDGSA